MTHYFDKEQTAPLREEIIKVHLFNKEFQYLSASGLFSREHVDNATKLLIEKCELSSGQKVLDLGCGWGAVALLIGERVSGLEITASDVNARAASYTRKNAKKYKLPIKVKASNLFEKLDDDYDVILTNPPYVAGRETCFAFIEGSFTHLKKGGNLQLVARHSKGGKVLEGHMQELFGNVTTVAKGSGFRIYKSVKEY